MAGGLTSENRFLFSRHCRRTKTTASCAPVSRQLQPAGRRERLDFKRGSHVVEDVSQTKGGKRANGGGGGKREREEIRARRWREEGERT